MIPLISSADQLITNFLHPVIQLSTLGGTRQKLLLQLLCLICRDIFFIAKLMFQTCPEIHRNRTKLYFYINILLCLLQYLQNTCPQKLSTGPGGTQGDATPSPLCAEDVEIDMHNITTCNLRAERKTKSTRNSKSRGQHAQGKNEIIQRPLAG